MHTNPSQPVSYNNNNNNNIINNNNPNKNSDETSSTRSETESSQGESQIFESPLSFFTQTIIQNQDSVVPDYLPVGGTIEGFNKVFPLQKHLFEKWKHWVKFWLNKSAPKVLRSRKPTPVTELYSQVIQKLEAAKLIERTKRNQYCSSFFCIKKSETEVRPIFVYSHITDHLATPKFYLPNIFQIVKRQKWGQNL